MQVQDLVTEALEICGVLAAGETPSAADGQTSLRALNSMLDLWSSENLALYSLTREVFELVPGQSRYLIGKSIGADFNTSRPMTFEGAAVGNLIKFPIYETPAPTVDDPDPAPVIVGYTLKVDQEFPIDIIDSQRWIGLTDKAMTSGMASYLYYEGGAQNAGINLWPVPTSMMGLVLYSKKALADFASLADEVDLPPGYKTAIAYNLAKRIAGRFGKAISADDSIIADKSLGAIKVKNSRTPRLVSDVMTKKTFNLISGE